MTDVLSRSVTICNKKGLHARASAALAKEASNFQSKITVAHEEVSADAESVMDMLMLTAYQGCAVTVTAEGPDAQAALEAVSTLIENRFGEEE